MGKWLEHSVQVEVPIPLEEAWSLWSDLEQMPRWMKWIESVKISEADPDISVWKFGSNGFNFDWKARIVRKIDGQIIQWESVDGLPNRGAVRFYDRHGSSIVRLAIAYAIPGIVGQIMDDLFLGRVVESTLQADMDRFKAYAIAR
ncbi:MAG: SRPBCC family protein [Cyanobacteria bacterium]|nr:SRPBCC family protein [Cyanobacteriota bacterium]